jgi:hypothetical protein
VGGWVVGVDVCISCCNQSSARVSSAPFIASSFTSIAPSPPPLSHPHRKVQPLPSGLQRRLQTAKAPQLSQADQARAVLRAFVAAEEEEEEQQQQQQRRRPPPNKPPVRLPSSKGRVTLVTATRPQPQPFPSNAHNKKRKVAPPPAPTITTASSLKPASAAVASSSASAASAAAAVAPVAARPSPKVTMDPGLAKYEAVDEDNAEGACCPGVSVERRRKVIRELVLALTAREGGGGGGGKGQQEEAAALGRAREQEDGWFRSARSKQEYQTLCRAALESLYQ